MDTAQLISAVYSELQSDYQALAPRKAASPVKQQKGGVS